MDMYEMIENIEKMVNTVVNSMTEVKPEQLGLDKRSAYRLYVSEEAIAISKNRDGSLQYYGGFEYVDKNSRIEVGDYVFYTADDERVAGSIQFYEDANANATEQV